MLHNLRKYEILDIRAIPIKKTNGGLVNYKHIEKDIRLFIKESNVVVTTFIDYFRLPSNFPQYNEAKEINNVNERINFLQNAFAYDIDSPKFLPYIQKHEFESLLFSSNKGFEEYCETNQFQQTEEIISAFQNPENINSSSENSPSNRLKRIICGYNKPFLGNMIALEVSIDSMLNKCPRFGVWVNKLIECTQ